MSCVILEDLVCRHFTDCLGYTSVHKVDYLTSPDEVHKRNDDKPYKETAAADDEGVFESDDVSETENCSSCVHLKDNLCLFSQCCSPWKNLCGEGFAPESEGRYDEVIESSDESADQKGRCSLSAAFSAYEYLCGGSSFRKRIFSMLFLDEVLSEWNQEKDAEDSSEE